MNIITIKAPKDVEFLSDIPELKGGLPKNCLFNKGRVGCGGTSIALNNNVPTIICVPFVPIITNKIDQSLNDPNFYPYELFGIHGKFKDEQLSQYLITAPVPKIMVTYNSLHKVLENAYVIESEYTLLIDEYHCLFREFSYRDTACLNVLSNYNRFGSYTFMSATPIEHDFLFEELRDIRVVNVEWEKSLDLKIIVKKCLKGVVKEVAMHIKDILNRDNSINHYFFVNSVSFIRTVIRNCKLDDSNCRAIYSANNAIKGLGVICGKPSDRVKKINFITKTAFEGADFYDENGVIYIVSDGQNAHTLIDISTQFLQISGRIRDSRYASIMYHLYSTTRYTENVSYQKFKQLNDEAFEDEKIFIEGLNGFKLTKHRVQAAKGKKLLFHMIDEVTGVVTEDKKAALVNLYNYRIMNRDYISQVNLAKEYNRNNLMNAKWIESNREMELLPILYFDFKNNILELECLSEQDDGKTGHKYREFLSAAKGRYSYIEDAIELLGFEGIRDLKYHTSNVQRKVIKLRPRDSEVSDMIKIQQLLYLDPKFQPGQTTTWEYVKRAINEVYRTLDYKQDATSGDIEKYFEADPDHWKLVNGKKQRVYIIFSLKPLD